MDVIAHVSGNKFSLMLTKYRYQIIIVIITIIALLSRLSLFYIYSKDMNIYLIPWYDYIKEHGIYYSLKNGVPGSDYTPIYLLFMGFMTLIPIKAIYVIKTLSVLFDMVCAISAFHIVKEYKKGVYPYIAYSAVLLAPTLILNSGRWGQCDSIFTAFILLSILAFLKNKRLLPGILFGISIAFKLQAVFFLPAIAFIYLKKTKNPIVTFGSMSVGFLFINLFPLFFGSPIKNMMLAYFRQIFSSYNQTLTLGVFPNIYSLIQNANEMSKAGLLLAFGIIILAFFILWEKIKSLHMNDILVIALFSLLLVPYLLPFMHERYYFPADVMSIIFGAVFIRYSIVPVCVILLSLFSYFHYLFGVTVFTNGFMAVLMLGVIIAIARGVVKGHFLPDVRRQGPEAENM